MPLDGNIQILMQRHQLILLRRLVKQCALHGHSLGGKQTTEPWPPLKLTRQLRTPRLIEQSPQPPHPQSHEPQCVELRHRIDRLSERLARRQSHLPPVAFKI